MYLLNFIAKTIAWVTIGAFLLFNSLFCAIVTLCIGVTNGKWKEEWVNYRKVMREMFDTFGLINYT